MRSRDNKLIPVRDFKANIYRTIKISYVQRKISVPHFHCSFPYYRAYVIFCCLLVNETTVTLIDGQWHTAAADNTLATVNVRKNAIKVVRRSRGGQRVERYGQSCAPVGRADDRRTLVTTTPGRQESHVGPSRPAHPSRRLSSRQPVPAAIKRKRNDWK